jgi:glycolate oxidase FAD binding subunit
VVKNVSGYDMMKLHYGALGTLGVIVAASFKVFPKPLHDVTLEAMFPSLDEAWTDSQRVLALPQAPTALELFADGSSLVRFSGSPDAVKRMVAESGWKPSNASVWEEHSRRASLHWARIAVPRSELKRILESLPPGETWWASPGVGIAHWSIDSVAGKVHYVRSLVEAAGGTLTMLAAPPEFMQEVGAWGTPPATLEVMRRIKRAFDPKGILNPGRFVV